ncbi:FtsW/RodA/SpoVE family cell cycle protein [Galbitalea sp. SE-J8]|uniref:FtsW/RodA/SpoVE family cell cycle protein n=1 Tax=Galbitalea sp. SE-J8 TaxID=3054952 RepID=UPI00259CD0CF|nr:FtsW/RodA/SpoVE family cell cycle protein [Galbitalea sp. SE-J8]MDM4763281.1 FtsW/RodA/SpoVE family cell cycle protein [Galbitalea sp. SE-J8]
MGELTGAIRIKLRQPARKRNLELVLLVLACAIDVAAIGLVQLGANDAIDWSLLTLGAVLTGLVLVFHIVLRVVAADADPLILPVVTVLNGLGIAEIYRIDIAEHTTDWSGNSIKQIVWTAIAMVLAITVVLVVRNHRTLQRYSFVAMFVGLALLLLPMLPFIGLRINGAQLWVGIGGARFQPGELAKIALAVFFAAYLVQARDTLSMTGRRILGIRLPRARTLGPLLVVFAVSMLVLIFQRDLGTSLLYFGLFLVVLYVGTGRASWVVLGLLLFAGGAYVAGTTLGYVGGRITNWLDAFNNHVYDAAGGSYQLVQGIFGLGAGGLTGTGLGQGRPDLVPLAESDYIVASLGEELGLIGLFAILALYLLFVSRGFRIGFAAQDDFGRLLGVGLSFVIALQVFIVIGGVTRVIPLTGLTTPFLAAGGSSLVANWIIAALLLRVSDSVRNQPRWIVEPREALS